ncbi:MULTISPECIES: helix-turn-helix domain-containing protein [Enterobacterales]|uniref:helix-turn-helix domain-containing protein n=1 Tax=Enterobacterales TaxID=91347 RepID=UPI002ED8B9EA
MNQNDCYLTDELHSFNLSLQTRPLDEVKRIHDALIPFSSPFTIPARRIFHFTQPDKSSVVLLLQEGFFSICREKDSLHIASGFAPTVSGLIDGCSSLYEIEHRPRHYFLAETECRGYSIPFGLLSEKIDELNLWHDVAIILAQRIMVMSAREHELIGGDAYTKVRAILIELWIYPADVRNEINVQHFIQMRTSISHSQVMKILSSLRAGGYINILRGKLTKLNKLPRSF